MSASNNFNTRLKEEQSARDSPTYLAAAAVCGYWMSSRPKESSVARSWRRVDWEDLRNMSPDLLGLNVRGRWCGLSLLAIDGHRGDSERKESWSRTVSATCDVQFCILESMGRSIPSVRAARRKGGLRVTERVASRALMMQTQ